MNSLRFSPSDLETNRQGDLTEKQRRRLDDHVNQVRKESIDLIRSVVLISAFLLCFLLIVGYNDAGYDVMRLFSPSRLPAFFVVSAALILLLWRWWIIVNHARTDIWIVEGTAEVTRFDKLVRGARPRHQVKICRVSSACVTFYFDDVESLHHFKSGELYRVYYIAWSTPYALSCEEIPPEKAKR